METSILRSNTPDKWGPLYEGQTHQTNGDPNIRIKHTRQMGTTSLSKLNTPDKWRPLY